MIGFVDIALGGQGEPVCRRCGAGQPGAAEPAVAALTEHVDRARVAYPGAGILFSEVDADALHELERLVEHAVVSGVIRVGVRMRGHRRVGPELVERLLRKGVRVVETVVLGSCAEAHDALAGTPGSFDAAVSLITSVREAADVLGVRAAVRGRVRVCRHTMHDLPATVVRLAELRVSSIVLECHPSLDPRRSADWIGAACDTGTVNRVWVAVSGMPAEALADKALHAHDVIDVAGTAP